MAEAKLNQRQRHILYLLKARKHMTASDISNILNCTVRTIGNDLIFLKQTHPQIITKCGRYDGGIYWVDREELC